MKIPPHEMFKLELDKYSMFDENVRDFSSFWAMGFPPPVVHTYLYMVIAILFQTSRAVLLMQKEEGRREGKGDILIYCALGSKVSVSHHFKGIFLLCSFVQSLYISFGSRYYKAKYTFLPTICMMFIHRFITLVQGQGIHLQVQTPQIFQN